MSASLLFLPSIITNILLKTAIFASSDFISVITSAKSSIAFEKFDIAYRYFQDIVDNHSNNTALVQQSLNKMANIKRDRNLFLESAQLFESAVSKDPKTEFANTGADDLASGFDGVS